MSGSHAHHHHADHSALTTRAAIASMAMALSLIALKGWAAWHTGSAAMLGSLADTALDLVASIVTFVGVRVAAAPADDNHRFGHGKAEAVVAFFQVNLIILSALAIGWRAVEQWQAGTRTSDPELGIGVSLVAIALTLALLAYQRRVIARTNSVAIKADSLHYSSDLSLNIAVIVALVLDYYAGVRGADPAFGIAIALWLLWGAWRTAQHVLDQLMDREWPVDRKRALLAVVADFPEATTIHMLRTRSSGAHDFIQFHFQVAPTTTIAEAHDIAHRMEDRIIAAFPGADVLIHAEPMGDALEEPGYAPSEGGAH
jgi:ferrous-iron efflux pump FieF